MTTCALCHRTVSYLTRHHLIPRTRHKNKRNKKMFARQDVKTRIVHLCRPCHHNIHVVLNNKELERDYNTLAALQQHPSITKFTAWVRNKPDGTAVRNHKNRRRLS